jgi:hypothetical protein
MTPDPSFVKDLYAYDPLLRVRYGKFTERWIIERKMPIHHPQLRGEAPKSERSARLKDLSIGYAEGYLHVLSVDPALLTWHHVAPALREADLHFAGSWEAFNRRLDEQEAAAEAKQDKAQRDWAYETSLEAHEHIQYAEGRRVALFDPPERVVRHPDGFIIKDRRHATA